ncbi:hypothetical protein BJ170DRAFT_624506 [Xylariales sp. AK1849]|nr:hypothetical protein BJ170DRAFT_624506 [Xylariales sp. AK1849]
MRLLYAGSLSGARAFILQLLSLAARLRGLHGTASNPQLRHPRVLEFSIDATVFRIAHDHAMHTRQVTCYSLGLKSESVMSLEAS